MRIRTTRGLRSPRRRSLEHAPAGKPSGDLSLSLNGTAISTMTVRVTSLPSFAPPTWPPRLPPRNLVRPVQFWIVVLLLILMAGLVQINIGRHWRPAPRLLEFLILCTALAGLVACGGGGEFMSSSPSIAVQHLSPQCSGKRTDVEFTIRDGRYRRHHRSIGVLRCQS